MREKKECEMRPMRLMGLMMLLLAAGAAGCGGGSAGAKAEAEVAGLRARVERLEAAETNQLRLLEAQARFHDEDVRHVRRMLELQVADLRDEVMVGRSNGAAGR